MATVTNSHDDSLGARSLERPPSAAGGWRVTETLVGRRATSAHDPAAEGREPELSRRFSPEQIIAVGGMGELRRHRDALLEREVVVKSIRHDQRADERAQQRFVREARIQAGLQHPCIVPVYDAGNLDRRDAYFTMAHIGGKTLHQVLERLRAGDRKAMSSFSRRQLLDAFCRVCLAVAFAHDRGVIHRDLKPENVMLGEYGEVYILDWGVAKRQERRASGPSRRALDEADALPHAGRDDDDDEPEIEALTVAGSTLGTLEYMAPEQYLGSHSLDERSDVYALGAILYEILGELWFRHAPSRADLVRLVWRETLRPLDRARPEGASPELDAVWRKATATKPRDRFQSVRELHDAIVSHLDAEREIVRSREMALALARDAALELETAGGSPVEAEARRGRALRSLGRALAVDPSQAEALEALVNDLLEHPAEAAPEVESEILAAEHTIALRAFRLSVVMYAVWLAFLMIGHLFMGVLSRAAMGSMGAVVLALLGYNLWASYRRRYERRHMMIMMVLGFGAISLTAAFLGPLVLLPSLATTMFAAFAVTMRSDHRARGVAMALSAAAVLVPALLQLAGVLPGSYLFEDGKIVIVPHLVSLPAHLAPVLLTAIAVLTVLFANLGTAQVVGELSRSERAALTQAYRLRQLLPARTSLVPDSKG